MCMFVFSIITQEPLDRFVFKFLIGELGIITGMVSARFVDFKFSGFTFNRIA